MVTLKSLKNPELIAILTEAHIEIPKKPKPTKPDLIKLIEDHLKDSEIQKILQKIGSSAQGPKESGTFIFTRDMYNQLLQRIDAIERNLTQIVSTNQGNDLIECNKQKSPIDLLENGNILSEINKIVQKSQHGTVWVTIDDLYGSLAISKQDLDRMDTRLLNLFYIEKIELAEGGSSKHKIQSRGRLFGLVKIRA